MILYSLLKSHVHVHLWQMCYRNYVTRWNGWSNVNIKALYCTNLDTSVIWIQLYIIVHSQRKRYFTLPNVHTYNLFFIYLLPIIRVTLFITCNILQSHNYLVNICKPHVLNLLNTIIISFVTKHKDLLVKLL